jgi:hypothetical protein
MEKDNKNEEIIKSMKLNYIKLIFYKLIFTFIHLKNNDSQAFVDDIRFLLLNLHRSGEEEI